MQHVIFDSLEDAQAFQSRVDAVKGYPSRGFIIDTEKGIKDFSKFLGTTHAHDIFKHPTLNKWAHCCCTPALLQDGEEAVELTEDWNVTCE